MKWVFYKLYVLSILQHLQFKSIRVHQIKRVLKIYIITQMKIGTIVHIFWFNLLRLNSLSKLDVIFHPITMHEYIYEHIKNKYIDDLHQQYKERYSRKL